MNENISIEEQNRQLFFRALAALESEEEAAAFMEKLCFPKYWKRVKKLPGAF